MGKNKLWLVCLCYCLITWTAWAQTEDILELPDEREDEMQEDGEPLPPLHAFLMYGHVDMRGWFGPRLTSPSSVSGQNIFPDGTPRPGRPRVGDLYGGARVINTFLGLEYFYETFFLSLLELDIEGNLNAFSAFSPQNTVSVRRAYGWIDVLRWANRDRDIGLKIWVGKLSFEEEPGFTAPHRLGGSATNFRLATHLELFRAAMFDELLWRIDVPVYTVREYANLHFTVTSDLDFSRDNNGWTIMAEATADRIRFGEVATWGINLYYHHWQGGDPQNPEELWVAKDGNTRHNNFSGRGLFGSHLLGGSSNITFFLPDRMRINIGFMGDYQWYFGEYLIQRFEQYFDVVETNGRLDTYFGHRKGSVAFQAGVHFLYPDWISLWAGWVNRATDVLGFSHDEGVVGIRSNGFLALRLDLLMIEAQTGISFYNGLTIGLTEARPGAWDQIGRVGYDIGLAYRPVSGFLLRTGWHAGSWFLGQIVAPGNSPSRSKDGQFYIRIQWAMRKTIWSSRQND